jgi:hypothetical protein
MNHNFNGNCLRKILSLVDDVSHCLDRELLLAKRRRIERVEQLPRIGKSDDDPAYTSICLAQSTRLHATSSHGWR